MLGSLQKGKVQLQMANRLWVEKSYTIEDLFQQILSSCYGADAFLTDFKSKPDESRLLINEWVENQTNQKIKDLLASGTITTLTCLVITNAVYFKGEWVYPFEEQSTREMPFHTSVDESEMPYVISHLNVSVNMRNPSTKLPISTKFLIYIKMSNNKKR